MGDLGGRFALGREVSQIEDDAASDKFLEVSAALDEIMDATAIYDITVECLEVFEHLASVGDAMASKKHAPSRDIRSLRNGFAFWVECTGALKLDEASLDERLEDHDELKQMVIENLENVERSLHSLEQSWDRNPTSSGTESRYFLSVIKVALDRLNCSASVCSADHHRSSADDMIETQDRVARMEYPMYPFELSQNISLAGMTPSQDNSMQCHPEIENFGTIVDEIFPSTGGRWSPEKQLEEVKDFQANAIMETYNFNKTCSSLFEYLGGHIACEAKESAKLHLSGFQNRQLEFLLGTDQHDLSPDCFSPPITANASVQGLNGELYIHVMAADHQRQTIQIKFSNGEVLEFALHHLTTDIMPTKTLYGLGLSLKDRKAIGVLLAYSFLQLFDSPWLQKAFRKENIFVLPDWKLHIPCDMSVVSSSRSLADDVAALGVLILELEADRLAGWTQEDEDYETELRSNEVRLSRILEEWKGNITDSYRGVGLACSRFENLVESFEHPQIHESLKSFAILYKCIVYPLYEVTVSGFGDTASRFSGFRGFYIPTVDGPTSASEQFKLYDELDSAREDEKSAYAEIFMDTLKDNVLERITALRKPLDFGLVLNGGMQGPEKIRIAVLDTGINGKDLMIKGAVKSSRIKERLSWVQAPNREWLEQYGPSPICEDKYGHGTHVTRLLLEVAPAAEIYVAKISDNKTSNRKDLWRIAEAIDWAREKWDVHIISMSFGFECRDEDISTAIDKVFKANKLMFAAASNEGGNKGRSRPARDSRVICIHACDGKGNKGDMNPRPQKRSANFTALGVAVKSQWEKRTVYKSGTSFATPVAAGYAANILEFATYKCRLDEHLQRRLYAKEGMEEVLRDMSVDIDGYDYVQPGFLWNGRTDEEVANKIREILDNI